MKQEEDKWLEHYRDCLNEYQEPVPDGVWDSLERDLKIIPLKPRRRFSKLAVAAVIFFAVLSSVSLYFLRSPQAEYIREVRSTAVVPEPSPSPVIALPAKESRITARIEPRIRKVTVEKSLAEENMEEKVEPDAAGQQTDPVKETPGSNTGRPTVSPVPGISFGKQEAWKDDPYKKAGTGIKKHKNRTVGVAVGNMPLSNSRSGGFKNSFEYGRRGVDEAYLIELMAEDGLDDKSTAAREAFQQIVMNNVNKEPKTETKHRMPVTVGVSIRFRILPHFSVETGLNYTLLSSRIKTGTADDYYVKEQKLHYIGIPLKGNWMFLNRKYVSLYLSAGGAVEKSVAGSLDTEYVVSGKENVHDGQQLKVKPLQWSLNSAIGIQYNATDHFGIFAEPGIVYYFDDRSSVETIRKEKPFNFNLQVGLRFTY